MPVVTRMTSFVEIGPDWEPLTNGQTFVLIQAISTGVVHIHGAAAGDSDPAGDEGHVTIARNSTDMESSFSAGGLPEGTRFFARAVKGRETISVLAY